MGQLVGRKYNFFFVRNVLDPSDLSKLGHVSLGVNLRHSRCVLNSSFVDPTVNHLLKGRVKHGMHYHQSDVGLDEQAKAIVS